ncbi:hypothetical protein [Halomarina oriensis]|uniref:Uncharacterized protein n=1 Tax=Halomarina oriensis TaxID=671145 RepID=A0A6B0GM22_9EURY|nr:hypothetical protein [Halomarina oriensis]MWG35774.1 hypothetical protein [Halomarina oriensis]
MTRTRNEPWAWLFGRDRRVTDRFLLVVGAVYLAVVLSSHGLGSAPTEPFRSWRYSQGVVVAAVVSVSGLHGYLNDGLVTGVALAYVLLVGVGAAGLVRVGVSPESGANAYVYVLLVLPFAFAAVLGTAGFVVGAGGRRLLRRGREQSPPSR